jgi:hypothetical protein
MPRNGGLDPAEEQVVGTAAPGQEPGDSDEDEQAGRLAFHALYYKVICIDDQVDPAPFTPS